MSIEATVNIVSWTNALDYLLGTRWTWSAPGRACRQMRATQDSPGLRLRSADRASSIYTFSLFTILHTLCRNHMASSLGDTGFCEEGSFQVLPRAHRHRPYSYLPPCLLSLFCFGFVVCDRQADDERTDSIVVFYSSAANKSSKFAFELEAKRNLG